MRASQRFIPVALMLLASVPAFADNALASDLTKKIDGIAADAVRQSGVPSASIAVVRDGRLAYARAYGSARLDPKTPATPSMRYSIGSISKEFTAAAILMLQQQGKLDLDDKVSKFFPELTDADMVALRQILSHTSGYQDYWPQDYLMPDMRKPTTPAQIIGGWAKKPLDFAPGAQWQYSNTGYVIAGAIVQKISGKTPFEFLQQNVFPKLGIDDAYDTNLKALPDTDARGYSRFALGPLLPSPKEGVNWMFGAGELAMTPSDLAKWDIAMIGQGLLQPASWRAMETTIVLNDGAPANYGLGVFVGRLDSHRMISHDGEVMGFTATNLIFPDDHVAVVVFINQEAVGTSGEIAKKIAQALFDVEDPAANKALTQAEEIFSGLQQGKLDRSLFTANCNSYFDATALKDYRQSLAPLGTPKSFEQKAWRQRGGMTMRRYEIDVRKRKLALVTYTMPDGKLEQYIVSAAGD
ncbi:MAG: serine hydrolase domain-containing protein [Rhodanobacteraceae bacterium]